MIPLRKNIIQKEMDSQTPASTQVLDSHLSVREFRFGNWRGFWTLMKREVHRFTKIWEQTLVSPLVMTLLFYAVFAVGFGEDRMVGSVSFLSFVIPGLVMMAMAQNAFANGAVSLVLSKLQGNIVDIMMPPLSPLEVASAYVLSGVVRGVVVGIISVGALALTSPVEGGSISLTDC